MMNSEIKSVLIAVIIGLFAFMVAVIASTFI